MLAKSEIKSLQTMSIEWKKGKTQNLLLFYPLLNWQSQAIIDRQINCKASNFRVLETNLLKEKFFLCKSILNYAALAFCVIHKLLNLNKSK